ncbi:hypothetical protein ACFQ0B_09905 [Nonomuraea thailandensis]
MTRPRTWSCAPARPATSAQWQRRLAETLGGILATHEDLAPIAWSIGAQGCTLLGLIDGHAPPWAATRPNAPTPNGRPPSACR